MAALGTAPHNRVTITANRHSGMFLAGIEKSFLDTGLRRYDEWNPDACFRMRSCHHGREEVAACP